MLIQSNDIKIEIDFRERLINQSVMPPLSRQRFESIGYHQRPQEIPFLQTLLGHQISIMM